MGEIRLPNFLIVGAAKSGTTSLYHYLKQHPEVYMSPKKEPRFIFSQFVKLPLNGPSGAEEEAAITKSYEEYRGLFEGRDGERAVGEASVENLYYYEYAIKHIKKILGEPRIIVILRNPVERAFSAYTYHLILNREHYPFEEALVREESRKRHNWSFSWHYKGLGFYYEQVLAYVKNFPDVKVCLYDDLKADPVRLMGDIYGFLGVDVSFVPDVRARHNVSGLPKSEGLHNILSRPNLLKKLIKPAIAGLVGEERLFMFMNGLRNMNLSRPEMNPETKESLKGDYREDILRLQDLIKRDLSKWLK